MLGKITEYFRINTNKKLNLHFYSYIQKAYQSTQYFDMNKLFLYIILLIPTFLVAQIGLQNDNTRDWWDITYYDLTIEPNIAQKTLEGKQILYFTTKPDALRNMQIDLQQPMQIDSMFVNEKRIQPTSVNAKFYIFHLEEMMLKTENQMVIYFHGKLPIAANAPWDGGWVFAKDKKQRDFVGLACETDGASIWMPCKEDWKDEPDHGGKMSIIVPKGMTAVSNGNLVAEKLYSDTKTIFTWEVKNPINIYNITTYLGYYQPIKKIFKGKKGDLSMQFWALDYDVEKAEQKMKQAEKTVEVFESWLGAFPFYEDGYKLVESPYEGMEHQTAIAYGDDFQNGYSGQDISGSGVGLSWDYIMVHETGHEWFGNSITATDVTEMWIHESFTTYCETLFVESTQGKEAAQKFILGERRLVENKAPIIGEYGGDMYFKGANMIHTLRQWMNDDAKFKKMLLDMNQTFYHKQISSSEMENYITNYTKLPLKNFFKQYLRTTKIPVLQYRINQKNVEYKWDNVVSPNFEMPVKLTNGTWIKPKSKWKKIKINPEDFKIDPNFYIQKSAVN